MQNRQQGFTLIELVVVIVILGLLAATALPKFINVTTDARVASMQGVAGGLRGAAALAQSQYLVNGNKNADTILLPDGNTVNVLCENNSAAPCSGQTAYPGLGGRPDPTSSGIGVMLPAPSDYTITYGTTDAGTATYVPPGGNTTDCYLSYTPSATEPVTLAITGC